jgi:UDP-N-acetyl-D-glucosamine dehydrogenase
MWFLMRNDVTKSEVKMSDGQAAQLLQRIERREALVGLIGLGYVGLPLMLAFCHAGFRTLGFDIDAEKATMLNRGESYLKHISSSKIADARDNTRFEATCDFARLTEVDVILICVPTPIGRHREPDLSFVVATAKDIGKNLRSGQLVVLESTTYPGTTREVVRPILEATGLKSGKDFFLAYSPEREDPGNASFGTATIPKVVAGDGERALRLALALYSNVVVNTVPVSSLDTAEAVKVTENVFRAVNIALVNELKIIFQAMGIDVFEVIESAKTKPFGFMPFYPGPGLGGHCVPVDPFYLTWRAREYGIATKFIELAGEVNTAMPQYVVERLRLELDRRFRKGLFKSRILIIGIAYKKDVDDLRESPALAIIDLLIAAGASVDYHDPLIPRIRAARKHGSLAGKKSVDMDPIVLNGYDAAVIVTNHSSIDYDVLLRAMPLVIDTRNVILRDSPFAHVVARA